MWVVADLPQGTDLCGIFLRTFFGIDSVIFLASAGHYVPVAVGDGAAFIVALLTICCVVGVLTSLVHAAATIAVAVPTQTRK